MVFKLKQHFDDVANSDDSPQKSWYHFVVHKMMYIVQCTCMYILSSRDSWYVFLHWNKIASHENSPKTPYSVFFGFFLNNKHTKNLHHIQRWHTNKQTNKQTKENKNNRERERKKKKLPKTNSEFNVQQHSVHSVVWMCQ